MAPIVDTYALGPTQTNCYVVRATTDASEAVVVDPGYEGLHPEQNVAAILVTHCHWDHLGGIAALAEASGAPVYMPEREAAVLENPQAFYPGQPIRPYSPDVRLQGDETFEVGGITFETLSVPGHSPGHVAYLTDDASSPATSFSRAASAGPIFRLPTGTSWSSRFDCCSSGSRLRPPSIPATARRRRSARSASATPSWPSFAQPGEVRGAEGNPRHPPLRAAPLAAGAR